MPAAGRTRELVLLEMPPEHPLRHNNATASGKIQLVDAVKEPTGAPVPHIEAGGAVQIIAELLQLQTKIKILP